MSRPELREGIRAALGGLSLRRREVTFVLGTDEDIPSERRVALTPDHLLRLRHDLAAGGIEARIVVLQGAGDRAGFPDETYRQADVELVSRDQVAKIRGIDVFHALKEPTEYESTIPGPFLRIGALHLASLPSGVCAMLTSKNFSAIIDGGTVGSCSYLRSGLDRTPIVASMSRFAGAVSGRKVVEGLERHGLGPGKIVVVGGGVAGLAAVEAVRPKLEHLVVVERYAPARERLPARLAELGVESNEVVPAINDDVLRDAVGVVFAHRSGASAAEKVCSFDQIRLMRPGAAIADIAIDQGGSILHDGYREDDDAHTARRKYQALLADYAYYAETNMPREVPREASVMHGDASLPYVVSLLALCAQHGDPVAAATEILRRPAESFQDAPDLGDRDLWECLLQDLRNGTQLAVRDGEAVVTDPDVEKDAHLGEWVRVCAAGMKH